MQHTFIYTILMVPEKQNEREEKKTTITMSNLNGNSNVFVISINRI